MARLLGAGALALIALFMFVGFLSTDVPRTTPAVLAAFALTVALPAGGAALLVLAHRAEQDRRTGRRALLRQRTAEAEILGLAAELGGRLTSVEVATRLAMRPEDARAALDSLTGRGHADLEVTDAGVLVYSFYDVRHLEGKASARGVLDA
jgi:hypothetical protein